MPRSIYETKNIQIIGNSIEKKCYGKCVWFEYEVFLYAIFMWFNLQTLKPAQNVSTQHFPLLDKEI